MLATIKSKLADLLFYELGDAGGRIRKHAGIIFLFIHFLLGFFCLWLTYYQLNMIVEKYGNELFWKSGLETFYLVAGVFWGNIGWDFYGKIKQGVSSSQIANYLIDFSAPAIFIFPLIVTMFQVVIGTAEEGFLWGYYQLTSSISWLAVFCLITLRALSKVRSIKKLKKLDESN